MAEKSYEPEQVNLFNSPARIIIAGYSNSGKTEIAKKIILQNHNKFDTILYCGTSHSPLNDEDELKQKLIVSESILNPFEYKSFCQNGILLVLDDCFIEAVETKYVVDAFSKGRHENISIIFITQNLFYSGKYSRSIALNCSHYILMRNRDIAQIENLARQIFGKSSSKDVVKIYQKALEYNQYGYLLIDLAPQTPTDLQFRTNIVGETPYQVIFTF